MWFAPPALGRLSLTALVPAVRLNRLPVNAYKMLPPAGGVAVGVFVGPTGVLVGVGVFDGGMDVFVGVFVGAIEVLVGVFVGLTGVLVGVGVVVGVAVGPPEPV